MKDTASISQANKISLTRKLILCLRQCCWKAGNGLWRRQQERASLCMLESLLQYCWELREFSRLRPFSLTKQAFSDILLIKSFCYSRRWLPWCQGCQESKHDSDAIKNVCCPSTESVSHFSQSTIHSSLLISKLCLCILTRKQSFHLNRNSMEQTRWWLGLGKGTGRQVWCLEVDLINKAEAKKQLTQASSSLHSHCHAEVACALTHA